MVKTGIERGTAWRQQCADGGHGAVSSAGCGTSGEDYGHEDVFECPVLFGCLCGRAGVYKKCGIDLYYFSYGTDDFCGDQLFCLSVPWK